MPFATFTPVPDIEDSPIQLIYLATGVVIMPGVGSPEGVVFAGPGSLFVNSSGQFYQKTTSFVFNTGWQQVQTAVLAGFGAEMIVASSVTSTSTSGLGLDNLISLTIPGGSLNADGRRINYVGDGNFNGAAGNKRLTFVFSGTLCFDTGLQAINNSNWHAEVQVIRLTSTTGLVTVREAHNGFGATSPIAGFASTTFIPVVDWNSNQTVLMQGEVANAADSVSQGSALASVL